MKDTWKTATLGDLCKAVGSGGTPKSTVTEYYDGGIPWLNTKEVDFNKIHTTERTISQAGYDNSSAKWIAENSVIVAMYGATAGKVAVNKIPLTTNQACCNLTIDAFKADYRFVYYHIKNNYNTITSLANGGAQQNLNSQIIRDFSISVPNLEIQKRIADVLSALDDKIELNRRINDNLEQQAQAIFKSWFVDSSTIEIANNWRQVKFSDIIDIKGGGTPNTSKQEYWDGNIPFFSPKDVTSSCYVLDTERKITDAGLKKCNSLLYPQNTVFITARGTVGKIVMAGCAMAMNQTNYALIGRDDCGQFTVYHIALQIVELLKKKANGAVFDAITTRDFNTEDLLLPSLSKMREFNEMVSPIYNYIHNNSIQNQKLIQLRDTLLPKLMSGELSVEEAERQI